MKRPRIPTNAKLKEESTFARLCDKPTAWIQPKPTLSWCNSEVAGRAVSWRVTNSEKSVWTHQKSKCKFRLKQARFWTAVLPVLRIARSSMRPGSIRKSGCFIRNRDQRPRNDGVWSASARELKECRTQITLDQMRSLLLSCLTCARTPARPWRA